ncbi:MAG: 50S ribosomal protein L7/L12 [Patescibacteria group bacterium]|nr:50S ribosomal protein L7/L12 [Patescibacteria group bacterium]
MAKENNQASEEAKVEEEKKEEKEEEEEEKEVEVPEKFKKLVQGIEEMSVLDLSELVKILEKKFGVSAMAPMTAVAGVAPAGEAPVEEKSVFNIELVSIGDKKIEVIKAVRDITEKGLKEAKDIVDSAMNSPQIVKENVKKDDAEEIKKKLETAGAKVELK